MTSIKRSKKILLSIAIILVAPQFIQPNVQVLLQNACYDCHSNNTRYLWYVNTQPMAWIMENYIKTGKEKLNFSDFGSYTVRRQASKLKGIANSIKDDIMPLSSYKLMHKIAKLSSADKTLIIDWMQKQADSLSSINN